VTDNFTWSTQPDSYHWSYSGDAYALPFDITDTRFVVYEGGNLSIPFSWNPTTLKASKLYGSSYYMNKPQPYTSTTFSFTQPYVGYALAFTGGGDPAVYSYNFSSTSTAPTGSLVVDLSTCAPALVATGYQSANDLIVSQDDQTFGIVLSTTSGQGSSGMVWIVIWNRTNGCRVWNTSTGAVTGAWGTKGTINMPDRFTVHNATLGPGGNWMYVQLSTCLSANNCATGVNQAYPGIQGYFWNISTLNVTGNTSLDACDHLALGYSIAVNECNYGSGYSPYTWYQRPFGAPQTTPPRGVINSNSISGGGVVQHGSWGNDNSTDTNPFCATSTNESFAPVNAYDNEIVCVQMSAAPGTANVWRLGHTYSTWKSGFYAQYAIGAVSADGKWFLWTSDWDGMLGNGNGSSNSCTLGTNCRTDVFITSFPLSTVAIAPPTGLSTVVVN
jgi:hypothetical protein